MRMEELSRLWPWKPPNGRALASAKPIAVLCVFAESAATAAAVALVIPLPVQAPFARPLLIWLARVASGLDAPSTSSTIAALLVRSNAPVQALVAPAMLSDFTLLTPELVPLFNIAIV